MYKVLLVDDEDIIKIGLRTIVDWEKYGFCIAGSANDGAQALAKVEEIQPDVIITDLVMPVMDGLELVRRLNQKNYDGITIVLSNYGDIKHVKQALRLGVEDYILKVSYNQEEFENLLLNLSDKLKNRVQKSFDTIPKESIRDYLLNEGNFVENEAVNYQLLTIKLTDQILRLEDDEYQLVYQKIKTILEEMLKKKQNLEVFQVRKGVILVVFDTGKEFFDTGNNIPEKIKKTLFMYLMIQVTILYSWNICGKDALKEKFESAVGKLSVSFYENVCSLEEDIQINTILDILNPIHISNKFVGYVREHEYERLQSELQMIVLNFQESFVEPIELKEFMQRVAVSIQMYFYEKYRSEILKGILTKIKKVNNVVELNEVINQMTEELSEYNISSGKNDIELIEKIKNCIEEDMGTKLSLNDIAEKLNFHPNYISTYFKQKTGQTLSYYMNSQKMKYAKKLLEQNKIKIKEVSEMVGYEDPLYFSRCFKKYFGFSPSKLEEN